MVSSLITGALGLGVLAVSAYMHVNGKDGSGWGVMAFFLIITSCSQAT